MANTGSVLNRPTISNLKGTLVPANETKAALTPSHRIAFTNQIEGDFLPNFQLTSRTIADPETTTFPSAFLLSPEETNQVNSAATFGQLLHEKLNAQKFYFAPNAAQLWAKLPEKDRTLFAYNNIVGQRIEKFFDEALQFLKTRALNPQEAANCRKAINLAHTDAYRNKRIEFDRASTGTYWSYCHNAVFVHVFEKMRDALAKNDPKRLFLQKQIDYIYTNIFTPQGTVDENNIETSLGLRAIDSFSRHIVSMSKESADSTKSSYVTLQIPSHNLNSPPRYAYRDGLDYYFEDTHEKLKPSDVRDLRELYSPSIVFRPLQEKEKVRPNIRHDWDKNHLIQMKKIDTSWWGFCDVRAILETYLADMKNSGGIIEFHSDNQNTMTLSREDLLEGIAALVNFDSTYVPVYSGDQANIFLGEYNQGGSRYYGNPETLVINTTGEHSQFSMRLSSIYEKNKPTQITDTKRAFSSKLPDAQLQSFTINHDVVHVEDGGTNYIEATERKFTAKTEGKTFDSHGQVVDLEIPFEIDLSQKTGNRFLISSQIISVANRTLARTYCDPKTRELFSVTTQFVQEGNQFKAIEETPVSLGAIEDLFIGREMQENDDAAGKLKIAEQAIRSGEKISADSDPGPKVWNGEVHSLAITTEYRSADGKWERLSLMSDATYGANKVSTIINQLDDEGNVIESCEVTAGVDFFWKQGPQVAPLISKNGVLYANQSMLERGVLNLAEGKVASIGALQDLYDLIYLGFQSTNTKPIYTIVHEGKRLIYTDEEQWKADVKRLEPQPEIISPAPVETVNNTPQPITAATPKKKNRFRTFFHL